MHVHAVPQVALKASQKQLAALAGDKPPAAQVSLAATAPPMLKAQSTQTEASTASEDAAATGVQRGGRSSSYRAASPAGSTGGSDTPGDAPAGDAALRKKLHQLQGALQQATADYALLLKELTAIRTEVAHHQAAANAASATEQQLRQQLAELRQQLQAGSGSATTWEPSAAGPQDRALLECGATGTPTRAGPAGSGAPARLATAGSGVPAGASHKQQQQQKQQELAEDGRGAGQDDKQGERDCASPAVWSTVAGDHWYDPLGSTMGKQALLEAGLGSRPLSPYTTQGGEMLQQRGTAAAGALGRQSGSTSPGSGELPMVKGFAGRLGVAGDVARRPAGLSSSRLAEVRHGGRQRSPERCLPPTGYR